MIMNESGIHTFCLKRKYSYSEIQNIIEQNKCFCCGKDMKNGIEAMITDAAA